MKKIQLKCIRAVNGVHNTFPPPPISKLIRCTLGLYAYIQYLYTCCWYENDIMTLFKCDVDNKIKLMKCNK